MSIESRTERRDRRISRWKARAAARRQRLQEALARPARRPAFRQLLLERARVRLGGRAKMLAAMQEHTDQEVNIIAKASKQAAK
jgi:hypothetical protein